MHINLRSILFFIVLLYIPMVYAQDSTPATIAQVVWVKGVVKAVKPDNTSRVLARRSPLYVQDTIVTDQASTGEIIFSDSSVLALRTNTTFRIDQYKFDPKNPKASDSSSIMSLIKGGFRTITGAIPKANPDNYQVNTPVATIGVRGTEYSAYCGDTNQCAYKLEQGMVILKNKAGSAELTLNLPYAVIGSSNSAPVAIREVPPVFKSDIPCSTCQSIKNGGGGFVTSFCIK